MNYESERIEYKKEFTTDIYKEVVAFANSGGGEIYVGIDDKGQKIGLSNIDETYNKITNGIRDNIHPDITMFIHYHLLEENIIQISINEGSSKPYYLKSKGIKPSGVYVRQGASSAPCSHEQIRQMIKENDGDQFEDYRSFNQDLTFHAAKVAFQKYNVELNEDKFISLGIQNINHHLYTNTALLISDQCQHTIKVAVFVDEDNTIFKDHQEFSGSIFEQLENTFRYLQFTNRTASKINGLVRIEQKDYPEDALREALLNAIIHRDYSFSGSIIININDKFTEFISIGGLVSGLSKEDIQNGISQPRNKNLANIFFQLRLIESYGTGIRKIFKLYENAAVKPKIIITPNTFKIILPNLNECNEELISKTDTQEITPQMQVIIDYLHKHHEIDEIGIQELLNIKRTRAYLITRRLCDLHLITIQGKGANKKYTLR